MAEEFKAAVMIIGSLYWDQNSYRSTLRNDFLQMDQTRSVKAPVRYGRYSNKRKTYTMVFSTELQDEQFGSAKLIPLKKDYCTLGRIEEANAAIINAEHKGEPNLERYNWGWGCLAVLINPKFNNEEVSRLWERQFGAGFNPKEYKVADEKPCVLSNGQLQIPWLDSYNQFDFVVVTATKPEIKKYPTSDILLETFKSDDHYFLGNYQKGIKTSQDDEIINPLMESKGFKQTKASWIPKDWELDSLKNLTKKITVGIATEVRPFVRNSGIPIIRNQNIKENYFDDGDIIYISKEFDEVNKKKRVQPSDVLIVRTGSNTGQACLVPDRFKNAQTFTTLIVRTNGKLTPQYLALHVNSYGVREVDRLAAGGGKPNLNAGFLKQYRIFLPPPEEQKSIASLIMKWDKAIENLSQLISEKEQKKKALMQQLLSGKKRFPEFEGDWLEVKLDKYFKERKETNRPELQLLSIGARGVYPQSESDKKDTSNADKSKYKRIYTGDIGYNTMRMWQGRSALSNLEGIVSPAYTIVTPKENADVLFFSYLFKLPYVVHRFYRNSQGLVGDTLNCKFKDFKLVKVLVPPTKEEQTKIAMVLYNADNEIRLLEKRRAYLTDQKKGLMQQLLTGKKRLKIENI